MKVSVTARHFDLTPDLRNHAETRITRLDKFAQKMISAVVVHELSSALQRHERGMPFIEMTHRGRQAKCFQRTPAADP